jgi:hypothetical protein
LRKSIIQLITNRYFDRFILFVIALNSLFLGLSDYSHVNSHGELTPEGSWRNTLIGRSEIVFTLIFTVECVLKIIGMGFYGPKGYLKDRWNWLDFLVVLTGSTPPSLPTNFLFFTHISSSLQVDLIYSIHPQRLHHPNLSGSPPS